MITLSQGCDMIPGSTRSYLYMLLYASSRKRQFPAAVFANILPCWNSRYLLKRFMSSIKPVMENMIPIRDSPARIFSQSSRRLKRSFRFSNRSFITCFIFKKHSSNISEATNNLCQIFFDFGFTHDCFIYEHSSRKLLCPSVISDWLKIFQIEFWASSQCKPLHWRQ